MSATGAVRTPYTGHTGASGTPWRIEARTEGEGVLGYTVGAWNLRPYTMRYASDTNTESMLTDVGLLHP